MAESEKTDDAAAADAWATALEAEEAQKAAGGSCLIAGTQGKTAGPSTAVRSGRDNSVEGQVFPPEAFAGTAELSSRPKRSAVEGPAVLTPGTHTVSQVRSSLFSCPLLREISRSTLFVAY